MKKKSINLKQVVFAAIVLSIIFQSCQKVDTIHMSDEMIDYKIKSSAVTRDSKSDVPVGPSPEVEVSSQVSLNVSIPTNATTQELTEFVSQNLNNISGQINMYLNGQLIYSITLLNGAQTSTNYEPPIDYGGDYPCNYEGIRKCAVDAIDKMGTVSKIVCAFEFYACFAPLVADCVVENCATSDEVPITIKPDNPLTPEAPPTPAAPGASLPGLGTTVYYHGFSVSYVRDLLNGHFPITSETLVYYQDGKHYRNSDKTCLLPNGFYYAGQPYPVTVYEIKEGVILYIYSLQPCPTCPQTTTFDTSSPFTGCYQGAAPTVPI